MRDKILDFQLQADKYKRLYEIKLAEKGTAKMARISVFAIMTQELEALTLDIVREFCREHDIAVHSLIYDAIVVENTVDSADFINGAQSYVADVTEWGIKIRLEQEW